MAKVVTDNQYYTAIANAIRALTGSSDTYTPAEMAPAIISYVAGVDLSDVEQYFVTQVVNGMKYVKNLGTDDWIHHIIVTDTHWNKNYGHSTAIIKAMQDSGYFSKFIHLGDMIDTQGDTDQKALAQSQYSQFNGDMLYVNGNHDGYADNWFYQTFMSNDTDVVFDSSSNYNYYWDDDEHRIRYIIYLWQNDGLPYLRTAYETIPTGYSVLLICHYKDRILPLMLDYFLLYDADFMGLVTGHYHIDGYQSSYDGIYNQTYLNNDGWVNNNATEKVDGTTTSQAITIMSINKSQRRVQFYRIGAETNGYGTQFGYNYPAHGGVEEWFAGHYWGTVSTTTNGIQVSDAGGHYLSSKVYDALDSNNNSIGYYITTSDRSLQQVFIIAYDVNKKYKVRYSQQPKAPFHGIMYVTNSGIRIGSQGNAGDCPYMLFSLKATTIASADEIVVTTERLPLNKTADSAGWTDGQYRNVSGTLTNDTTAATSASAFDVIPEATYRLYVDDADWSGSNYFYIHGWGADFAVVGRYGSGSSGTKSVNITIPSNVYYATISIRNLPSDYASKIHWERVS